MPLWSPRPADPAPMGAAPSCVQARSRCASRLWVKLVHGPELPSMVGRSGGNAGAGGEHHCLCFFFMLFFFFFLLFLLGTRSCLPNGKSPPPRKELILERLKRFTLPFQVTVKCSNASPQERLSLGFFPDALGWNFPPDSTGKKSASAKNKASPTSSKAGMELPCEDWGTTAPHGPHAQEAV